MKLIALSFDDGETQDERLAELLRRFRLKAAFGLCCGFLGKSGPLSDPRHSYYRKIPAERVKGVYRGFELCSHGFTHKSFSSCDETELSEEIGGDIRWMEALTGVRPRGAIYPGGEYAADTPARLSSLGIRYARTTRPTYGFGLPENFLLWHPTCHFYDERVEELIEKFAEEKEERVSLFHLYGHSYELDYGKGWQYIEALFRRLTAMEGARSMSYAEIYELFGTNKKGGGG